MKFMTRLSCWLMSKKYSFHYDHFNYVHYTVLAIVIYTTRARYIWHDNCELAIQSTPDNSNLQGKLKMVRIIRSSSYRELRTNDRKYVKKTVFTVFDSYNVHFNQI